MSTRFCTVVLSLLSALVIGSSTSGLAGSEQGAASGQVRQSSAEPQSVARVKIGRSVYLAEVARTPAEQMKGLMFRRSLRHDGGMLFVFGEEGFRSFWMKNTLIPLDIIFVTKEQRIDSFYTMSPCPGDPCPTYRSTGRVVYALEINAGEISRHGFKAGDRVEISMPPAGRPTKR